MIKQIYVRLSYIIAYEGDMETFQSFRKVIVVMLTYCLLLE